MKKSFLLAIFAFIATAAFAALDQNYVYGEPTTITISGKQCLNLAYKFTQNNIEVKTTKGTQNESYFSCNDGYSMTFTATQEIKGLKINGLVQKDFVATVSSGDVTCVNTASCDVEADPVLIITNINSKTITITCTKQLFCYSIDFYFQENPVVNEEDESWGNPSYDWEPDTPVNLGMTFDTTYYTDYSAEMGEPYVNIYLASKDYEFELEVLSPFVKNTIIAPGTYEISMAHEEGKVVGSIGSDGITDYPTCLYTNFEYDEANQVWMYDTYYIVSGTLTVEPDPAGVKMTLNANSFKGSGVKAEFVGKAESMFVNEFEDLEDEDDGVLTGIKDVNSNTKVARKMINNKRIEILRANKRFDTKGVEFK